MGIRTQRERSDIVRRRIAVFAFLASIAAFIVVVAFWRHQTYAIQKGTVLGTCRLSDFTVNNRYAVFLVTDNGEKYHLARVREKAYSAMIAAATNGSRVSVSGSWQRYRCYGRYKLRSLWPPETRSEVARWHLEELIADPVHFFFDTRELERADAALPFPQETDFFMVVDHITEASR